MSPYVAKVRKLVDHICGEEAIDVEMAVVCAHEKGLGNVSENGDKENG